MKKIDDVRALKDKINLARGLTPAQRRMLEQMAKEKRRSQRKAGRAVEELRDLDLNL